MEQLPCKGCKGLCCGPVSITAKELAKIKKKIKSMPARLRTNLEKQTRYHGTCIFYDVENDKCGIYSARPEVCKRFGYHKNLACFRNPNLAISDPYVQEDEKIGVLSIDFTWKDF
ncbi:YkgJ family cysteine cluster protein [Neobacillus muris]|uniref:YkgJ family cysteine cluster protein n=1 Tax=Neobacillus muris TaxID=2941334 RepID=UPI00203C5BAD|nr:YkgJ family cysteine cluster protein [Neobacillus muris]